MPAARPPTLSNTPRRQHGVALMIMLIIMVVGAAAIFVASLNSSAIQIARDKTTADALAKAKDALIGYAVSNPNRPGGLPCPDTNDDGSAESTVGGNCPAYIGRLPWKTLGLPALRDGSGEEPWYALSPNFRDDNAVYINSDSVGKLTVSGATPASNVIAIVFASGNVLSGQGRSATQTAACTTTNSTIAQSLCATNYLEGSNPALNTAMAQNLNYQSAAASPAFNDGLMIIGTSDLIFLVEKRVARELKSVLANYRSANGVYPFPAKLTNCTLGNCDSDATQCRGWVPLKSEPQDWTTAGQPWSLPQWFMNNGWYRSIHYSANASVLGPYNEGSGTWPASCTNPLNVSGTPVNMLFFMPGTPLAGQTRPSLTTNLTSVSQLAFYLDAPENQNMDNVYVAPSAPSNDSLFTSP